MSGLLVNNYSQRNPPTLGEAFTGLLGNWGDNIEQGLLSALPVLAENDPYKIGQQLLREGAGVGGIAWHGSPHKFAKPDLSKIGTGEGAQAYGHGFYSAEDIDVAKNYSPRDYDYEDALSKAYNRASNSGDYEAMEVYERAMMHYTPAEIRADALDPESTLYGMQDTALRISDEISEIPINNSHLYKMNIPDETIDKMLDWDKPLSEQKYALKSLRDHYEKTYGDPDIVMQQLGLSPKMRGGELYRELGGTMQNQRHASGVLNTAGIPGIKYLDGDSRAAGQGSRNFVSFTPDHIEMLERNGIPMKGLLGE